jgi:ribosomal protein S18 acetylase RimI-like enzyme
MLAIRFAAHADLTFVQTDLPLAVAERKLTTQEILLAEAGNVPVGLLRLEYLWSHRPYIALIRVLPEHQRQGVGRALLAFLEIHLHQNGHTTLYSSSQANEAEPQAWHRRVGFVECGFIAGINEGGVGEVFFQKRLVG